MKKIISVSVVTVGCLAILWFCARPAYRRHQESRAVAQARDYMAKGDYRNASLSAHRALQINPSNLEACQISAVLAERARSPHALDWWRRIVELAPAISNKLMLASVALRVQGPPYQLAAQTLEELTEPAASIAAYHAVCAELALRLKRTQEAVAQFEQASRIEPGNELYQLNLAVLGLQSDDEGAKGRARATLDRLRASTNVGAVALRWLVADSLGRNDFSAAEKFSRQLLTDRRAVMDDRLQHLTVLHQSNDPEFKGYLSALQTNALTNATEVYAISAWMIGRGLVDDALAWLMACPAKLRGEQPVPLALVDCYLAKKDWRALDTFLQEQKWGDLEFLRAAFLSRAAAQLNQTLAAEARWKTALRCADDRLGPLTALLSLASNWGQQQAQEYILWQIARHFPRDRWPLRELEKAYVTAGNTVGLNRVYSTMTSFTPQNFIAQNNFAATSLLLKLNLPRAHELARQLFTQHPDEAVIASTYAFSLHLQGRTKEGLAVLQKLKPNALEAPAVALYYGVLLSASGHADTAAKYLDIAGKSELLPEEKTLLAEAVKRRVVRN